MIDDRLHPVIEDKRVMIHSQRDLDLAIARTLRKDGHMMTEEERWEHKKMYRKMFRRKVKAAESFRARKKARLARERAQEK